VNSEENKKRELFIYVRESRRSAFPLFYWLDSGSVGWEDERREIKSNRKIFDNRGSRGFSKVKHIF
jgi:hypothetical protein